MMILHMPQICRYHQSDAINPYNAAANNIGQMFNGLEYHYQSLISTGNLMSMVPIILFGNSKKYHQF